MADSFLRYTDLATTIQMARSAGMTTIEIVRLLSGSIPYSEALKLARRAAPLLDLTITEFMQLRRNE